MRVNDQHTWNTRCTKYKTEYCRNMSACPYGESCIYAHSCHELRIPRHHAKYRQTPCWSWISTGACPYRDKCSFVHDPRLMCKALDYLNFRVTRPLGIQGPTSESDVIHWPPLHHVDRPSTPYIEYNVDPKTHNGKIALDIYHSLVQSVSGSQKCSDAHVLQTR